MIVLILGMALLLAGDKSQDFFTDLQRTFTVRNITGRPLSLQQKVDEQFLEKSSSRPNLFEYRGETVHNLMGIEDRKVIDLVVMNAIGRRQKDVYFLDLGAGAFQWINEMSAYINEQYSEIGLIFHFFGLTERATGNKQNEEVLNGYTVEFSRQQSGNCHLCLYAKFPIENIAALLTDYNDTFDLIVSNCTFSAMRDPAYTFIQTYNLLRPNSGLFLMENFNIDLKKSYEEVFGVLYKEVPLNANDSPFDLFLDALNINYMTLCMMDYGNVYNNTIIRRTDARIEMRMKYLGDVSKKPNKKICCFEKPLNQLANNLFHLWFIPGELFMQDFRIYPTIMLKYLLIKGRNYKDLLTICVPIFQEKRNMQAMAMQIKSSRIARSVEKIYRDAVHIFLTNQATSFAAFYANEYDSVTVEDQEVENVKKTLDLLLYVIFKVRNPYLDATCGHKVYNA
jgi:SAM-dependent methyltransferase